MSSEHNPPDAQPSELNDEHTEPEPLTDEHVKQCLQDASTLKEEGNDEFRAQKWDQALAIYRRALGRLPKRTDSSDTASGRKEKSVDGTVDEALQEAEPTSESVSEPVETPQAVTPIVPPTELQKECSKARAVLNANIAACYVKLGEHKDAVAACTEALLDDPNYIKALQRRAASNEQLDSWSSLTSAQEDYTKLISLLPSNSPQLVETRRLLQALRPRVEAAQKRETGEMIDKLKGLGNSILGNFGLSTDNFQFIPNGQGGYSMNFVR